MKDFFKSFFASLLAIIVSGVIFVGLVIAGIVAISKAVTEKEKKHFLSFGDKHYKNVEELDSIQQYGKPNEKLSSFNYWLDRKVLMVEEHNTMEEIVEKFKESFVHNLPKVLFIYMPIFAFMLWLFHSKRKW